MKLVDQIVQRTRTQMVSSQEASPAVAPRRFSAAFVGPKGLSRGFQFEPGVSV